MALTESSEATAVGAAAKEDCSKELSREAALMASAEVVHSAYVPFKLHRQLEFMEFNKEGHLMLGCSDLNGRYWTGSLWYFRDPSEAPSMEKALTGVDCDNGVVDGRFIGDKSKQMLVALDSGAVELVALTFSDDNPETSGHEAFFFLERLKSVQEHDDIITGLDLTSNENKVVTSSYDSTVVVLDVNTLQLSQRISDSQDNLISNVACNRRVPNLIATASNDGTVSVWDLNSNAITSRIYDDPSRWPCYVEWAPWSENLALVGNQVGQVSLHDTRNAEKPVFSEKVLDKQIHQIKFSHPDSPRMFSASGDSCRVKVMSFNEDGTSFTTRYSDDRHDDFVRGMAWQPGSGNLFTCGWDHQVNEHDLRKA